MPLIKYTIYKTISKTIRTINSRDFYLFSIFFQSLPGHMSFPMGKKITQISDNSPPTHIHTQTKVLSRPQILYLSGKLNHFLALQQVTCKSSLPILLKANHPS